MVLTPQQYQHLWDTCEIDNHWQMELQSVISTISHNADRYHKVSGLTTVPWYVIAALHYRESTLNFRRHLHNGDPLTDRTKHVPAGRPVQGTPPFTWEESAVDALKGRGLHLITWDLPETLKQVERYNGGGYMKRGINSPYLWAATNHYGTAPNIGKYVADGKFDPTVKDGQLGAAAIMQILIT